MIEFVLQEPFVPEGVILNVSISVYEASFAVPHIERIAKLLYAAERAIEQEQFDVEQARDSER